ncbi:MAG: hypothetical protein IT450_24045 [Phycisphaerales bacterium]|nr:hypothetical protein [Phycisphaerales bacterium]
MDASIDPGELERIAVPDWGLECLHCRYLLRGLTSRVCPECGTPFRVADLIRTWTRTHPPRFSAATRPLPDFGLHCSQCRAPLAGVTESRCPACAAAFDLAGIEPRKDWFIADEALARPLDLLNLAVLLEAEAIPYYPQSGKSFTDLVMGRVAFGANLVIPREFYWDVRLLVRRAAVDIEQRRARPDGGWTCGQCGEESPAHFEVCWNCGSTRPA